MNREFLVKNNLSCLKEEITRRIVINPTKNNYIRGILGETKQFMKSLGEKIEIKYGGRNKKDFHLTLSLSALRSSLLRNKHRHAIPKLDISEHSIRTFSLGGSYIDKNLRYGNARGIIAQDDSYIRYFLTEFIQSNCRPEGCTRLHSASLVKKNKVVLLAGEHNAGKTTFSKLLNKYRQFKIIDDDHTTLTNINNKIYAIENTVGKPQHHLAPPYLLIFIQFKPRELSKWELFPPKEALKKIIFLSEFPLNEDVPQSQRRLDILKNLIEQCRCYSLINGKDLLSDFPNIIKKIGL